jgi:hypothetical protein
MPANCVTEVSSRFQTSCSLWTEKVGTTHSRHRYKSEVDYAARNNLGVVAQEGYNYDRPRGFREGKDWDETS